MSESLASFRDLKGIGPATEARLHETGIYTWEALGAAASALAAIRGDGDTLRDVATVVAARRAESSTTAASGDHERLESFVLRLALAPDGRAQRCEVTHVRTMTGQTWTGWTPAELIAFVQEHSGLRFEPPAAESVPRPRRRPVTGTARSVRPAGSSEPPAPAAPAMASEHRLVLDAGKAIGGTGRDIDLVVATTAAKGDFGYRATLAARRLGADDNGTAWKTVATSNGTGSPAAQLALGFPGVSLPVGIHRLRLRLDMTLAEPAPEPPALALA